MAGRALLHGGHIHRGVMAATRAASKDIPDQVDNGKDALVALNVVRALAATAAAFLRRGGLGLEPRARRAAQDARGMHTLHPRALLRLGHNLG